MTHTHIPVDQCTAPVGPSVPTSRNPLEMFSYFFDEQLLSLIVDETNRFAAQCLAASNTTWETNLVEIRTYLEFIVVMGINKLPLLLVNRRQALHNNFIASHITRKRFEAISRYLHFVDNETLPTRDEPGYHRLQKILPIIAAMKERLQKAYNAQPQASIDEAMIPFSGEKLPRLCIIHTCYVCKALADSRCPRIS